MGCFRDKTSEPVDHSIIGKNLASGTSTDRALYGMAKKSKLTGEIVTISTNVVVHIMQLSEKPVFARKSPPDFLRHGFFVA